MSAPPNTFMVRNATVTLNDTTFANAIGRARLVPNTNVAEYPTVDGGTVYAADSPKWVFEVSGLQIMHTGGIAKIINDAADDNNSPVECILSPNGSAAASGQPMATFSFIPVHLPFGGDAGALANFEQDFRVIDQPEFGVTEAE